MEFSTIEEIDQKISQQIQSPKEELNKLLESIIGDLPDNLKQLISEAFENNRIPKEYLFTSILFAYSNACGLTFRLDSMGYLNYGNLYLAIIGSRGDMKSPAMELATAPLNNYDTLKFREFKEQSLNSDDDEIIKRKQILIQDATIEAAQQKHYHNPCSIGIYTDELYQLFEKMSNPSSKDGPAWRTFLLQGNTNKHIDISRKTTEDFRLGKSYPVLLGSLQTEFLSKIFGGGNLESGLVDRILFTQKITHNSKLNSKKIDPSILKIYQDNIFRILNYRIEHFSTEEDDKEITLRCSVQAEEKIQTYSQKLLNDQQTSPPIMDAYISKMLIVIHKMTLLLHMIKQSQKPELEEIISEKTVIEAIRIMDFYQTNFQQIIDGYSKKNEAKFDFNAVIVKGRKHGATCEEIAKVLGVNKSTVSRKLKHLES